MTVVNIAGTTPVDDPSYRYKMPLVFGKVEGRGNGIKTVIPNISEVSLSLHRDAGEVNKFFGCELGAQTTYSVENDRAVVNGSHTDNALQSMIHKYIESFVLCPQCGLPETHYKIKDGCIYHKCAACGAKEMVDMGHKLCTYILAQHKKKKKEASKKAKDSAKDGKDGKKSRKSTKKDKDSKEDDGNKTKKKKKKDKEKEKKKEKVKKDASDNEVSSLVSETDPDDVVDDAGAIQLAVEGVQKFMQDNPNANVSEIAEVVVNQQMSSAVGSHEKVHILMRAIITPSFHKNKEIKKYASLITKVTLNNEIMERHLIGAVEFLCIEKPKVFPVMLKELYDEEALQEDVILQWAAMGRSNYTSDAVDEEKRSELRGEAEPFIAWLEDDDDSSGSESE